MAAITWRNVYGPSLEESSDILTAAGNSFNAGLDSLDKMLKQREAVQLANQEAVVKNNGNAYQNLLASAKTPEELAALEGKLAEAGASYGGQIDPALLRDGMRNQMNQLRTQANETYNYDQQQLTQKSAPIIEAFRVADLNNDKVTQARLMQENPNIPWSTHLAADKASDRTLVEQQRADELAPFIQENAVSTAKLTAAQLKANQETLADQELAKRTVTTLSTEFNRATGDYNKKASMIAGALKIPLDKHGNPDLENRSITTKQLTDYKTWIEQLGPVPSSTVFTGKLKEALASNPTAYGIAAPQLDGLLKSGSQLSSEDQAKEADYSGKLDALATKAKAENHFYIDPATKHKEKSAVLGRIDAELKDNDWTKEVTRKNLSYVLENGISIEKEGKTVTVPVSPRLMDLALTASMERDASFFTSNRTDDRVIETIKQMLMAPENTKLREEAEYYQADGDSAIKKQFGTELRKNTGATSPRELVERLNEQIARRTVKQNTGGSTGSW